MQSQLQINRNIKELLILLREEWGLFQTEVAAYLGRDDQHLSDITKGKANGTTALLDSLVLLKKDCQEAECSPLETRLRALRSGDSSALEKTRRRTVSEEKKDFKERLAALRKKRFEQ
jgi:hypothetical protein